MTMRAGAPALAFFVFLAPAAAFLPPRTARAPRAPLHAQQLSSSAPVRDAEALDDATLASPLLRQLQELEGIWYSDDFYGTHGREWVEVSATIIGPAGTRSLEAVKASGDDNVPAGFLTWRTRGLPTVGGGEVPAEVQVRSDVNDPNGFSFVPGSLSQQATDQIVVTVIYLGLGRHSGTFHRHKTGEGA